MYNAPAIGVGTYGTNTVYEPSFRSSMINAGTNASSISCSMINAGTNASSISASAGVNAASCTLPVMLAVNPYSKV